MDTTPSPNDDDTTYALRQRIADLEAIVGLSWAPPRALKLSPHESRVLGMILAGKARTAERIYTVLYGDHSDPPIGNIVAVWVAKVRAKLRPHDIAIEHSRDLGWRINPENTERLNALYDTDEQRAA